MTDFDKHSHLVKISVPIVFQIEGYNRNGQSDSNASNAVVLGSLYNFKNTPGLSNEVRFLFPQITDYPKNVYLDFKFRTDEASGLKFRCDFGWGGNAYGDDAPIKWTKTMKGDGTDFYTIPSGSTGLTVRGVDIKKLINPISGYNFSIFFYFETNPVDAQFYIDRLRVFGTVDLGGAYAKH
ncbi:MAG: hypothetical protein COZ07_06310 [Candidatus Infernicultor aquiphilus]|uniref:Uncharacterized protein n=1 Tax=Candidatus Infernicultor aquiphilus TaxID=1805029 RepID=A0A2M7PNT1_9BACT|nr:MAG: hypothetical protein COZ07_06310 [Candidatus Atribacteria bacterium CG_4_10_14_3_um_filter_34_13]